MVVKYIGPTIPLIPLQTSQQPIAPNAGEIRFNTTTHSFEAYDGTSWQTVAQNITNEKLEITTGKEKFGECEYWVEAMPGGLFSERREKNLEIDRWVVETYGPPSDWGYGRWTSADSRYWFKKEADRDWFVMKWSS